MLRFNDGVNIHTAGPYRVIHLKDGYYVVGKGLCCPVDDRKEGDELVTDLKRIDQGQEPERKNK